VNLFSGAIFIQQTIGWDIYWSILLLLSVTSVCTITGGLSAVMWTETAQSIIMIFGSGTLTILALNKIGGFRNLYKEYMKAVPSIIPANLTECAVPKPNSFLLLRSINDPDMPWLGFILGQTTASIWYWCTDQMMVQRLLAAKSLSHSQGGVLFAGYLKLLPFFLIILPGMISRILYPNEVACVAPEECLKYCQNENSCSNTAYPKLVLGLMPSPLKGLLMSVMLAALMSDLSSIFNSSSTLFTCDIWPLFRKKASNMELMVVGRAFVVVMILISIAWIPIIQSMQNGQLYLYIQDVGSNLAPPIAAIYIMAVLFKRVNEPGVFWALMVGLLVGCARMFLNLIYNEPNCGDLDVRPYFVRIHYMYFAIILFWITVIICFMISYLTQPPKEYLLIRTTYWSRYDKTERLDEVGEENESIEKNHATNTISISNHGDCESNNQSLPEKNFVQKFIVWFCGLESSKTNKFNDDVNNNLDCIENIDENLQSDRIKPNGIKQIGSIEQTMKEKIILTSALVIIIFLAFFIYIFFSIPNWWKIIFDMS
ncbi:sodium/glucose cotransporter-like protein, partial [Sarcoptes scabiei]